MFKTDDTDIASRRVLQAAVASFAQPRQRDRLGLLDKSRAQFKSST